jgi:hypothetical protein
MSTSIKSRRPSIVVSKECVAVVESPVERFLEHLGVALLGDHAPVVAGL